MPDPFDRLKQALTDRYRIQCELGQGGMATVYLATDLKHDRNVAIKVLKAELAAVLGAERFVQEIKTTAQLQHPHILPLFDSGEADGFLYYVMPYVEGETLREKLDRETQLGIAEAVRIATEVADALDYAHRHGVIHRDIKPDNILLHDGRPLVMDFGIALAVSAAAGGRMTETGLSLGTPHYMSPEQATADKHISNRSDVYSLGTVLYEMLTGEPPHTGASAQAIILKVVSDPARPLTELRKSVPPHVAAATAKALEKLPADRFETARAFAEALNNPAFTAAAAGAASAGSAQPPRRPTRLIATLSAIAVVATVLAAWGWLRSTADSRLAVAFYLDPPVIAMSLGGTTIAPDGRMVVAEIDTDSGPVLYRRRLDDPTWVRIPGTEGATNPVFSPDGHDLAFANGSAVQVMSLEGHTPRTVATSNHPLGITWAPNRTLIYDEGAQTGSCGGLMQVSVVAGSPHRLTSVDTTALACWFPSWIPGTDVVLYEAVSRQGEVYVEALSLASGHSVRLVPGLSPQADSAGHVSYVTPQGTLVAQDLDLDKLALVGGARTVADRVGTFSGNLGFFAVGAEGSVIYRSPREGEEALLLVDREGRVRSRLATSGPGMGLAHVRFAPSGNAVAYVVTEGVSDRGALYVRSLERETSQRLTFSGDVADPAWTPDGRSIAFSLVRDSADRAAELAMVAADGSGSGPRRLLSAPMSLWQLAFGPDGKTVVMRLDTRTNDLGTAVLGRDTVPSLLMKTDAREEHAVLSPDGRWMAYSSNETGRAEVYVRTFPGLGPMTAVSTDGGSMPVWGAHGRTLYYEGRSRLFEVTLAFTGNEARVVERTPLFRTDWLRATVNRSWDVAPDGQRFVVIGGQLNQAIWKVGALRHMGP